MVFYPCPGTKSREFSCGLYLQRCWVALHSVYSWQRLRPLFSPCAVSVQTPQTPAALSCPRAEWAAPHFPLCWTQFLILRPRSSGWKGSGSSIPSRGTECFVLGERERESELETTQVPVCPLSQADMTIYSSRMCHVSALLMNFSFMFHYLGSSHYWYLSMPVCFKFLFSYF